jgi:uncharacterized membrane protein
MHPRIRTALDRWVGAGLIDAATAARIGAFEAREEPRQGARWPAILAWALGGILLGAGALLFVSAHWDRLSPSGRFSLVLLTVAAFHVGAAFVAGRYAALATVLHAVGTVALGAGIFLAGQIFNLQEHWPGGVMLWALGAAFGWWLLRDAAQAALLALLAPAWLIGEWTVATDLVFGGTRLLGQGLIVLAAVYLGARTAERTGAARDGAARQALVWIGGLALIPTVLVTVIEDWHDPSRATLSTGLLIAGWAAGIVLPLGLAVALRGGAAWVNGVAAVWAIGLAGLARRAARYAVAGANPVTGALPARPFWPQVGLYGWCALGSVGLVYWGLSEARRERINLGVAGFALTVVFFYFSSIMDKLGRSASLIGLGVLFLLGGWALERTRRRLIARLDAGRP